MVKVTFHLLETCKGKFPGENLEFHVTIHQFLVLLFKTSRRQDLQVKGIKARIHRTWIRGKIYHYKHCMRDTIVGIKLGDLLMIVMKKEELELWNSDKYVGEIGAERSTDV